LAEINPSLNVRKYVNQEELEGLKDSIKALGLLQPIVVMTTSRRNQYRLIVGKRRYMACDQLGWKTIPAQVMKEEERRKALALSLAENIQRDELTYKEMSNAVTELYRLYDQNEEALRKATGMSPTTIRRLIRADMFASKRMKELFEAGSATLMDVTRALQAAQYNVGQAERVLDAIVEMTGAQKKRVTQLAREHPKAKLEDILHEAVRPTYERKLYIDLSDELHNALGRATKALQKDEDEVALQALEEWLRDKGFWQ
jgi:ParB family chromosome partitioning protein